MDAELNAEQLAFRNRLRDWLAAEFPAAPDLEDPVTLERWEQLLIDRGWQAYKWPEAAGGPGWDLVQKYLWEREVGGLGLPLMLRGSGIAMLGPILYGFGTAEQQQRFLPPILENRVRFEAVRAPITQRIGAEGEGWTVAKGLLNHERTGLAFLSLSQRKLRIAREALAAQPQHAEETRSLRSRLERLQIEIDALATTELKVLAETAGGQPPTDSASILKLKGTQLLQAITEVLIECAAYAGLSYPLSEEGLPPRERPEPKYAQAEMAQYLIARSASIAGGSDEIQYGVIAKHVLKL